jgi:hypothetical protein
MDFTCWDKTVQIVVPILLSRLAVLLAILAVGLLFFFIWQVLLDPRIGSPLVFALKLAEVNDNIAYAYAHAFGLAEPCMCFGKAEA